MSTKKDAAYAALQKVAMGVVKDADTGELEFDVELGSFDAPSDAIQHAKERGDVQMVYSAATGEIYWAHSGEEGG